MSKRQWATPPHTVRVDLQNAPWFMELADLGVSVVELVHLRKTLRRPVLVVLLVVLFLSERALKSPWGRMMQAIQDNEDAAEAMGKDVKGRHLEVFVLGSAVIGIAGAMLTTLDGSRRFLISRCASLF